MRLPAARRILKHFLAVVRQGGLRDLAKVGKALRGREPGIKEDCFLAELGRELRRRPPGRQRFRPACQTIVTQQDAAPLCKPPPARRGLSCTWEESRGGTGWVSTGGS